MSASTSTRLLDPLFTTDRMRAVFSDRGRLQGMLDFEAALARAEARAGVIPAAAAAPIESQCRADAFDIDELARGSALAGNTAIPLVKALTALVAKRDEAAARFVHWGATSQDAMDTGLVLQLRSALDLIEADLARLSAVLAGLAGEHKRTVLAGRTWLQQATPVTFGLKAAGALSAIDRHRARIRELRPRALVLQFGGASGTLAALGADGLKVAATLADELEARPSRRAVARPPRPDRRGRDRARPAGRHARARSPGTSRC